MDILKNKEFSKTTKIIIIINLMLFISILSVITLSYNEFKQIYIESKANSIALLVSKYPEIATDIVNDSFENIDDNNVKKGLDIINDYGYTSDLEWRFINDLNTPFIKYIPIGIVLLFLFMILELILNYVYHKNLYKKVKNLIYVSKEILSGNYDISIDEYEEGEFSKLACSFREMRDVIKNQMNTINKEKVFLINLMSDISHQIKTPLSSTIAFNEILMRENITAEVRQKFLNKSKIQLERIEWLVKSLLKLSKLDAGAIKFDIKENDLNNIVQESVYNLEHIAMINNVDLIFERETEELSIIKGDKEWIKEALMNIIKNGIEHSKGGWVKVDVESNNALERVSIKDNGCGIKEEDLKNIFTRFYKSNKPDSVGIGLALSKSIIEQNQGYIEVKSIYGEGTTFNIIFTS